MCGPGSQGQEEHRQELRRHGAEADALASRRERAWLQREFARRGPCPCPCRRGRPVRCLPACSRVRGVSQVVWTVESEYFTNGTLSVSCNVSSCGWHAKPGKRRFVRNGLPRRISLQRRRGPWIMMNGHRVRSQLGPHGSAHHGSRPGAVGAQRSIVLLVSIQPSARPCGSQQQGGL